MNLIRDLASICLAAVLSTGGHAANIQTDGSSGSVQAALSNAQSGDTVVIPNGTYHWTAPITVNTYVTLQGASVGGGNDYRRYPDQWRHDHGQQLA